MPKVVYHECIVQKMSTSIQVQPLDIDSKDIPKVFQGASGRNTVRVNLLWGDMWVQHLSHNAKKLILHMRPLPFFGCTCSFSKFHLF